MINKYLQKQLFSSVKHSRFCIIGGGTGSLSVASHLKKEKGIYAKDITLFEPSKFHFYQPGFTMVAGGIYEQKLTKKLNSEVFAKSLHIVHQKVNQVRPEQNQLITESGEKWSYDNLIIATGINCDFSQIKGSLDALNDPNCPVGSAYTFEYAEKMRKIGKHFQGGDFLFTEPQMPIKCAGAPQKVLFLTEHIARQNGKRQNSQFKYLCAKGVTFSVKKYSDILDKLHQEKQISVNHNHKLIEIKKNEQIAIFQNLQSKENVQLKFDAMHIVPPQIPPTFIKESGLGDQAGYVNVNQKTMQHVQYHNIWSLGDSCSTPNSKTAASIFSQTPVLIQNLKDYIKKKHEFQAFYDGYASCPIFTGDNKLLLAEFKYNQVVDESFPFDQGTPQKSFFHLKKSIFPWAYWNLVPKGYWHGKKTIIPNFKKLFERFY